MNIGCKLDQLYRDKSDKLGRTTDSDSTERLILGITTA